MSLRTRALLIIGVIFLALMAALALASRVVVLKGFERIEVAHIRQSVLRVENELESALSRLRSIAGDWGPWDDTYEFIQNGNEGYIKNNLNAESMANLRIDFMLFVDLSQALKFSVAVDLAEGREQSLPGDFWEKVFSRSMPFDFSEAKIDESGILVYEETPLLFAARGISKSDFSGPIKGTLVVGKFIDSREVELLSKLTRLPLDVMAVNSEKAPSDFKKALSFISDDDPVAVLPMDRQSIAGYAIEKGIDGKPAFILKIIEARDIYNQGWMTLIYFLIFAMGICIIFIVTIMLLIDNLVIAPLISISEKVALIGKREDPSKRLELSSRGELGQLELAINTMLGRIQEARDRIKALEGLIPICSECKKIRDDAGYWQKVEEYVQTRTRVQFTHGICPDCAKILYPKHDIYAHKKNRSGNNDG